MECADGTFAEVIGDDWNGCLNQGSHMFRCPFPYIPCEQKWDVPIKEFDSKIESGIYQEFYCGINCDNYGGKRVSTNGGNVFKESFVISKHSFFSRYKVH